MKTYKVLVHPVRSRIVGALGGRRLTRRQMEGLMPDVPPPTLYRNLRVLVDSGLVETVERLPRRGVDEHVYAIKAGGAWISREEMAKAGPVEWLNGLETFLSGISASYRAYLAAGGLEQCPASGHVVYATKEELAEVSLQMRRLLAPLMKRSSTGRERHIVSMVFQPDEWPGGRDG